MKYRSRIGIISQILQAANGRDDVTKTHLMYMAFLSYHQSNRYLAILTKNGLLEHDAATFTYKTTGKGMKFLEIYEEMGELTLTETKLPEGQK